jgi:hypothetical protein
MNMNDNENREREGDLYRDRESENINEAMGTVVAFYKPPERYDEP